MLDTPNNLTTPFQEKKIHNTKQMCRFPRKSKQKGISKKWEKQDSSLLHFFRVLPQIAPGYTQWKKQYHLEVGDTWLQCSDSVLPLFSVPPSYEPGLAIWPSRTQGMGKNDILQLKSGSIIIINYHYYYFPL